MRNLQGMILVQTRRLSKDSDPACAFKINLTNGQRRVHHPVKYFHWFASSIEENDISLSYILHKSFEKDNRSTVY